MAKIVLSSDAPTDAKTFSLGNDVIEVPTESDDPTLIANATVHPWLDVEVEGVAEKPRYRETGVDPAKDPLSAENPDSRIPFDAAAVAAFEDAKVEAIEPVAIDAAEDQDKKGRKAQPVAVTVAAAEAGVSKTTTDNAGDAS